MAKKSKRGLKSPATAENQDQVQTQGKRMKAKAAKLLARISAQVSAAKARMSKAAPRPDQRR